MKLSDVQKTALLEVARDAAEMAYAPYSNFHVGAAILDERGLVYGGCNVENVAYPQGACAEAGAISAMIHAGGREVAAVLVLADSPVPITPCGGCRQRLAEFSRPSTPIILANSTGITGETTLAALFPQGFTPDHLGDIEP